MSLFFPITNILLGLFITSIGFKLYNPWQDQNDPEKEAAWYKRYGKLYRIGGIILTILGVVNTILKLS